MHKLLQINCTSNWGSTGKIAEQIGLCAQAHGWECYVAFGRDSNTSAMKNIKVGNMLWTVEHYAENRILDNEGLASRIPTKRLLKEIDRIHPDVVHMHNIHDHWLNYKILFEYLAEKQIPVVWTQHDQWATTGHCCYNLVGCDRWKTECYDCPLNKWYSLDRSRRNFNLKKNLCAGLKSLTIVPVSEWLADNMRQSHLKDRPIEVIHNGIDINVFKPQAMDAHKRYGIAEGKKILLAVASVWSDAKGLSDYIKLSEVLPDDYIIVLVGLKESQIASLPQRIVGLPRTQNVTDLVQLYSMAHIVMSLSYSETFGLSIVEGMACGTPAIVYDNTAQKYLIDEKTGLSVKTGDIAGVAEAVKLLDTRIESNAEGISADCLKRAGEYYDKNKNYQSYISLYNKMLGGGKIMLLGVAAPWSERKGLQDYIALSKILPPEYVIVLIGLDKEQIESLPDNMVGVGRTQNQAELAAYYSMADILLSLSTGETFGMTMAEAYGCGTPVIVYDNTAQPEIVTPETGRVVKTGDINALSDTIMEMISEDFKHKHSSDCRKRAEECFDKDKCFEKYIELYEQILANK